MATPTKRAPVKKAFDNPDNLPVDPGIETWKNTSESMSYITKIGEYGRRETDLIHAGKVFALTPQERRLNQSQTHDPANDPFTNGLFQPLVLLEEEPDTERLRDNPNVLDDDRIAKLFRLSGDQFSQRLVEITNPTAVDRLIELARQPTIGATVSQLDILKRYKQLLAGEKDESAAEPGPDSAPEGIPRAVTPR